MTDYTTRLVADYVYDLGVKQSAISRATGISEGILYRSLSMGKRNLRAGEFLAICTFLKVDPMRFYKPAQRKENT